MQPKASAGETQRMAACLQTPAERASANHGVRNVLKLVVVAGTFAFAFRNLDWLISYKVAHPAVNRLSSARRPQTAGSLESSAIEPSRRSSKNLELDQYVLAANVIKLRAVSGNLSGLTYNRRRNSLFLIVNYPPQVVELGLDFSVKRMISLIGFDDTEGIAHIQGDLYAIVEEKRRTVCLVEIAGDVSSVNDFRAERIRLETHESDKDGLEGIGYDPVGDRVFIVKERYARSIFELSLAAARSRRPVYTHPWDIERNSLSLADLTGLYVHAETGHLLILSHESLSVVECTTDGTELSRLRLAAGSAGLKSGIPQPEGITMDDAGRLYICSEPNLLYVFDKPKQNSQSGRAAQRGKH